MVLKPALRREVTAFGAGLEEMQVLGVENGPELLIRLNFRADRHARDK
jgi:hypothetical protein